MGELTRFCNISENTPVLAKPDKWLIHNSIQENMITEALGPGAADEELSRGFGVVLRCQDFWTLKSSEWLNNQVRQSYYLHISFTLL